MKTRHWFKKGGSFLLTCLLALIAVPAFAESAHHGLNGAALSIWWIVPFAGLLLSIAIMPLKAEEFWDNHFGKVSAFWGLCIVIPMLFLVGFETTLYEILHVYMLEYFPFIVLLFALFTISGGVRITGTLRGTPGVNTIMLTIGTLLASWMGTTGAAMLMIRPMLRANAWRKKKVHMVVFFIFLVCNVGGSLTPIGDPPLFLGFLQGVDFFWTTIHILPEMLFVSVILIVGYYAWDRHLFKKEDWQADEDEEKEPIGIEGKFNLILLVGVVGFVLFSGIYDLGTFQVYGIHIAVAGMIRDIGLLILSWISWRFTSKESRAANGFTWFPIKEVGYLFAGIFITIVTPLAMLEAAQEGQGALQFVHAALFDAAGNPNNAVFFWITGMLSSFLDNAPTYLIFFNAAGGNAQVLMTELAGTLRAVSTGAVFFGAVTYIGNAPNFMVKSIAEQSGIDMPSFGGYMLWTFGILIPIYILVTLIFF